MMRAIYWIAINAGVAWLAWLGVHGNAGAGNVVVFVAWVHCITSVAALANPVALKTIREKGSAMPPIVEACWTIGMMCLLTWHGWWLTAIAFLIGDLAQFAIFEKEETK